ncbi:MAG TPA: hypothetical protein VI756_32610, partial [Blastocatellia bacterium]
VVLPGVGCVDERVVVFVRGEGDEVIQRREAMADKRVEVLVENLGPRLHQKGSVTSEPDIVALLGDPRNATRPMVKETTAPAKEIMGKKVVARVTRPTAGRVT